MFGLVYYLFLDGDDFNDGLVSKLWKIILVSLVKVEFGSMLKFLVGKFRLMLENFGMVNVFLKFKYGGLVNVFKVI